MKRLTAILLGTLLTLTACGALANALTVEFYDVGKADAMLITTPQGTRILIDTATNKEGKALAERFDRAGIGRIDVMIITHYDEDHVGGADKLLEEFDVGTVIMPTYDKESKQHTQFEEALAAVEGVEEIRMGRAETRMFDLEPGVTFTVTSAHEAGYGEDEENDFSLAVRLTYGDTRFFFTGDAENARQRELLAEGNVACDVLKVPYHGRLEASSQDFLTACGPEIAFITDSDEEPASALVVDMLETMGTKVFCAKDGGLRVTSDGTRVWAETMN